MGSDRVRCVAASFVATLILVALTPSVAFATPPSDPTNLIVLAGTVSPQIASLSWSEPLDNSASFYAVYVALSATGPFRTVGVTPGTSYDFTSGVPGMTYFFRVGSVNGGGEESAPVAADPVASLWTTSPHASHSAGAQQCTLCHAASHSVENTAGPLFRWEIGNPTERSICLACHAGTVSNAANVESGTRASFSMASGHQTDPASSGPTAVRGCSSCHALHVTTDTSPMLPARRSNDTTVTGAGRSLCETCHKTGASVFGTNYPSVATPTYDATGYPVSGTWPGAAVYDSASSAHARIPESTQTVAPGESVKRGAGDCVYCHAAHRGPNAYDGLVATFTVTTPSTLASDQATGSYAALCLNCHQSAVPSGFATAPVDIKSFITSSSVTAGHRIVTSGGLLPVGAPLPCFECHSPHGSTRNNASGLSDVLGASLQTSNAAGVRSFCFTCHSTADGAKGWDSTAGGSYTSVGSQKVVGIARTGGLLKLPTVPGHNSTDMISCYSCHGQSYTPNGNNVHNPSTGGFTASTHVSTSGSAFISVGMENSDHDLSYGVDANCSDCHITDLLVLHVNDCEACHFSTDPNVVAAINSGNTDCTACHPSVHTDDNSNHEDVYSQGCNCHDDSSDWNDPGQTCTECHGPTTPDPSPWTTSDARPAYSGDALITLSPSDNVSESFGIKSTYFTLDAASTAIGTSVAVSAPATGTASHTLVFWSTDWSGHTEAAHTVTFTVSADATPPVTTSDAASSYIGPATVHLTATDDSQAGVASTYYVLDAGAATASTTVTVAQPASGLASHTLKFWSVDHSGNVEATKTVAFSITADLVPPHTTTTLPQYTSSNYVWFYLYPTDPAPASGVANLSLMVDGGPAWWGPYNYGSGTWAAYLNLQGQGPHTVTYWAVDNAGNAETVETSTVFLDNLPPTTTTNAKPAYNTTATISLIATDNGGSGVAGTQYYLNGTWTVASTITVSAVGSYTIYYRSFDAVGNYETLKTLNFVIDKTPPVTSSNAVATYNATATITLTPTDAGGSGLKATYYRLDSGATTTGTVVTTGVGGSHTLQFWSVDNATNVEATKTATFTLNVADTIAPTTTSNALAAYNTTATVSLSATDNPGGSGVKATYYKLDSGALTTGTVATTSTAGSHTLLFYSVDNSSNKEATNTATFIIDRVVPVTTSDAAASYLGTATVTLTPSDGGGSGLKGTYFKLDAGATTTGTAVTVSPPAAGFVAHTLLFWSVDNATNTETTHTVSFNVGAPDTTPPVTTSDAAASYVGTASVTLSAVDTGTAGVKATYYRLDAGATTTGTVITVAPPASGSATHTISFWSVDTVGNTESAKGATFTVVPGQTYTAHFDAGGPQYFIVPAGVSAVTIDSAGGQGGDGYYSSGGAGGVLHAVVPVTAGHTLTLAVGQWGNNGNYGGGYGGTGEISWGGGSTSVADGATILTEAGGGGGGSDEGDDGNAGGYQGTVPGGNRSADDESGGGEGCGGGGGWNAGAGNQGGNPADGGTSYVNVGSGTYSPGASYGDGWVDISFAMAPDTTPPTTSSDATSSYIGQSTITLLAADNTGGSGLAATHWRLDSGAAQTGASVPIRTPGDHTLEFWSVDWAGNTEAVHTVSFHVVIPDTIAPTTTSDAQSVYTWDPTISLSAADNPGGSSVYATYYRLDTGLTTTGTSVPVSGNGVHTLRFWSVDYNGNTEATNTATFLIDRIAPTTTTDARPAYNTTATISLTATDNPGGSGVAGTRYYLGGWYYGTTVSVSAAGSYTLYYQSWDTAGNYETLKTLNFVIDKTPPVTSSNAVATYNATATITLTPTDAGGSGLKATYYRLDSGATTTGTVVTTGVGGSHTLQFWSVDNATNVEATKTATFTLNVADTIAPTTTSNALAAYNTTATVSLSATDNPGGSGVKATYYKLDSGALTTGTVATTSTAGSHTLLFYSVDNSSNKEATNTATFIIDRVVPVTTSDAAASYLGTATVTLTPSDGGGSGLKGTYFKLDAGATTTGTAVTVSPPAAGFVAHTLLFWSVDNATNTETTHTVSFNVGAPDTTPPVTTSDAAASYVGTASVTLSAVDTGTAGVKATYYRLDAGATTTGTVITVAPPASGSATHTISFWSVDTVGNTESAKGATFTVVPGQVTNVDFAYIGDYQTLVVPAGVTTITVDVYGAQGGMGGGSGEGGYGGRVQATVPVTPGWTLTLAVGGQGADSYAGGAGGWPNGGAGSDGSCGGAGGGSTSLWHGGDLLLEAGAGGGGNHEPMQGGMGGWQGYLPGGFQWGEDSLDGDGAGGGGGWNGGFGAVEHDPTGGGSSYVAIGSGTLTQGVKMGDGAALIGWTLPGPDTIAPAGAMAVNGGSAYTTSTAVTVDSSVTDTYTGVAAMAIDPGVGTFGTWIPYAASSPIVLPGGDGTKTVRVLYKDAASNVTTLTDTIVQDSTGPAGVMAVNNDSAYAASTTVSVNATMSDATSGLYRMRIDPGSGTYGSWIAYSASTAVALPNGDGTKTVTAQYQDNAGNVSTLADVIVLDTGAPTGTMVVNGDSTYATSTAVTVTSAVMDSVSGVASMSIDPGTGTYGPWTAYAGSSAISLPNSDGSKTVRVQYRDKAGNLLTLGDTIVLDATGPTGTMYVNNNASYASTRSVTINAAMADTISGIASMSIDPGTGTFGAWTAYSATTSIVLPPVDGTKTVRVQFWSGAGSISTKTDAIFVDTYAPTTTSNAVSNYSVSAAITLHGDDAGGSGIKATYYILDGGPQTQSTYVTATGTGPHALEFWSVDNANNSESPHNHVSFTIAAAGGPITTFVDESPYDYDNAFIELDAAATAGIAYTNYTIDGSETQWYNGPFQVFGAGEHTIEYWSVDGLGQEEVHKTSTLTVSDGPVDDTHDITVRVLNGGEPVEGVDMVLCTTQDPDDNYASWDWYWHATTDADGYATWSHMPGRVGGYRVRTVDYQQKAFYYELVPGYTGDTSERTLDISNADDTAYANVTVRDAGGTPMSGVDIWAELPNGDHAQSGNWSGNDATGVTDDSGSAQLDFTPTHMPVVIHARDAQGHEVTSDDVYVDFGGKTQDVDLSINNVQAFSATGADQYFTVPAGVTALTISAKGASGGAGWNGAAGAGGRVSASVVVLPGSTYVVRVGVHGDEVNRGSGTLVGGGGWPNGGNGDDSGDTGLEGGGGGGGSSSLLLGATTLLEAGGGGGGGDSVDVPGGDGGWLSLGSGSGNSRGADAQTDGGGGGGGWDGGATVDPYGTNQAGGQGGSSFVGALHTGTPDFTGTNAGDGSVIVSW